MVSSTRLGSTRIIRTSSGVDRVRIEVIRPPRHTELWVGMHDRLARYIRLGLLTAIQRTGTDSIGRTSVMYRRRVVLVGSTWRCRASFRLSRNTGSCGVKAMVKAVDVLSLRPVHGLVLRVALYPRPCTSSSTPYARSRLVTVNSAAPWGLQ